MLFSRKSRHSLNLDSVVVSFHFAKLGMAQFRTAETMQDGGDEDLF